MLIYGDGGDGLADSHEAHTQPFLLVPGKDSSVVWWTEYAIIYDLATQSGGSFAFVLDLKVPLDFLGSSNHCYFHISWYIFFWGFGPIFSLKI